MSDSYHDWDGESLTRSQLYTFRKNPRDFYNRYVLGLAQARSKALVFGSAFHALTLEGREVFDKDFVQTFERSWISSSTLGRNSMGTKSNSARRTSP